MGLSLQQDRRRHRSDITRCFTSIYASDLFMGIQSRLLDIARCQSRADPVSPYCCNRLSALESLCPSHLASHGWLPSPGRALGRVYLLFDATAAEPGADAGKSWLSGSGTGWFTQGGTMSPTLFFPRKRHKSCIRERPTRSSFQEKSGAGEH